jgi:hypothetical protein
VGGKTTGSNPSRRKRYAMAACWQPRKKIRTAPEANEQNLVIDML